MPVITQDFGSFFLTFAYGSSDKTLYGHLADYSDWESFPPEDPPDNIIYAGPGNDRVWTGFGNDIAFGGAGNDTLIAWGSGAPTPGANSTFYSRLENDILDGGAGNDVLLAGGGEDLLFGGTGNDELHGGAQADRIFGGSGDDEIWGGGGPDQLWGGAGADTFVKALAPSTSDADFADGQADTIFDFEPGTDKLSLAGYQVAAGEATFTATARGLTVSFDFFGSMVSIDLLGVPALQNGDIIYAA
ncbi:calcium-binding protein [Pseudoroseomonas globiformis]|uniref:Calcium-binding protein n=1 Tax=Teichococcus globiformis TaxID=2307229 RepID=A0ABV7FYP2_9PROT